LVTVSPVISITILQVDDMRYEKGESVDDLAKAGAGDWRTSKLQTTDGRKSTDIANES
jgi:hypothetical protein